MDLTIYYSDNHVFVGHFQAFLFFIFRIFLNHDCLFLVYYLGFEIIETEFEKHLNSLL